MIAEKRLREQSSRNWDLFNELVLMFKVDFDSVFGEGVCTNGMQVTEGFEIPLAIIFRFILGEFLIKRNVLISQWHPFPPLFQQ